MGEASHPAPNQRKVWLYPLIKISFVDQNPNYSIKFV